MPCASRFGGPGENFAGRLIRGVTTRVANWPSGLSFGPVSDPGGEPVRQRSQHPRLVEDDCARCHRDDAGGNDARRRLVHGIGKSQQAHARNVYLLAVIRTATRATSSSAPASGRSVVQQPLAELRKREPRQGTGSFGELAQADLQRLQASFDQSVGEQQHRRADGQVHHVIGARLARAEPEQQVRAAFEELDVSVGADQQAAADGPRSTSAAGAPLPGRRRAPERPPPLPSC